MIDNLYTVNTGTVTTGDVLTYNNTSSAWTSSTWTIETAIKTKLSVNVPAKPAIIKEFWEGVEWKEHTSYLPRKSITGKWIIGKMHKRWRTPDPVNRGQGLGVFKEFANTKELFAEKLKGKA